MDEDLKCQAVATVASYIFVVDRVDHTDIYERVSAAAIAMVHS